MEPDDKKLLNEHLKGETYNVEFKREFPNNADSLGQNIASFATSNPGFIYVGIDKNGVFYRNPDLETPEGKDEFQQRVIGVVGKVKPVPDVKVKFLEMDSGEGVIARITVTKGYKPIYYYNGIPYVRYLSESRPATPDEAEELHRKFFERERVPSSSPTATVEDKEKAQFLSKLLVQLSDVQLALSDIADHQVNPQLDQLQYDLGNSGEIIRALASQSTMEELRIDRSQLVKIAKALTDLERHQFFLGSETWNAFLKKGDALASQVLPIVDFVRKNIVPNENSVREYKNMVKTAIEELKNEWDVGRGYQFGQDLEGLRDYFRIAGYNFHRLANLPESDKVGIRPELLDLSKRLRTLSTTKGWGYSGLGFSHTRHVEPEVESLITVGKEIVKKID